MKPRLNLHLFFIFLLLISCEDSIESKDQEMTASAVEKVINNDQPKELLDEELGLSDAEVGLAKEWLFKAIEKYFSENEMNTLESITTESYAEYKIDAMNLAFEHGLSQAEFERKWKGKYDVSQDAFDKGFLIDAQDYGKIIVEKCNYLRNVGTDGCVFQLVLYDELFESKYKTDVTVVIYEGSWAIGNVKDYFSRGN